MKIIKLNKNSCEDSLNRFYVLFDEIPELTYMKIGSDYVGSVEDKEGNMILRRFLKYCSYCTTPEFAWKFHSKESKLNMKDGTIQIINDFWYDFNYYEGHKDFVSIGAGSLEELQKCYIYHDININKIAFNKMISDYFSRDELYGYDEIKKWCKLQCEWYDVIISGEKIPYMVNKYGDFIQCETKEFIYPRWGKDYLKYKYKYNKNFNSCLFKLKYMQDDKLIKIERKMIDVLSESLPYSVEEIKNNCNLN